MKNKHEYDASKNILGILPFFDSELINDTTYTMIADKLMTKSIGQDQICNLMADHQKRLWQACDRAFPTN